MPPDSVFYLMIFILCLANPPRLQIQLQKQPAVPSISIPSVEFYGRDANLCKYFFSFLAISNLVKEVIWHGFWLIILNAHLKDNLSKCVLEYIGNYSFI